MVWPPMVTECCVVEILSFASAGGRALRGSSRGASARSSFSVAGGVSRRAPVGAGWRFGADSGDCAKSETESVSSAANIAFFMAAHCKATDGTVSFAHDQENHAGADRR